jgi:hypothetical protein
MIIAANVNAGMAKHQTSKETRDLPRLVAAISNETPHKAMLA